MSSTSGDSNLITTSDTAHKLKNDGNNFNQNTVQTPKVTQNSHSSEKVNLFMSLFSGREDVYAKRWENKDGRNGYAPACSNDWVQWVCEKPRVKCADCNNRKYVEVSNTTIQEHLLGKKVVGIYPMLQDETCRFLVMDFDKEQWQQNVSAIREICDEIGIVPHVERSRSGNGAHIWFFFSEAIPCSVARKLGSSLLTSAMSKRHEMNFSSYDRLLPNQDTMPKGGFGNLIALPLQKLARENGNSVFIDENFIALTDQWAYLSCIKKISLKEVEKFLSKLSITSELGELMKSSENEDEPWGKKKRSVTISRNDFPKKATIVKANMLHIEKEGFTSAGLNYMKRLAAFKNPAFYKAQAMRLSTYNIPRIIATHEETEKYVSLPRGLEKQLKDILNNVNIIDQTNPGIKIDVQFNGTLREEQEAAIAPFLTNNLGVLSATTAFGKTVIGAKLIAERKTNTLILVHRTQLLQQWKERLSEFLTINEVPLEELTPTGRKKKKEIIGQIGGGKTNRSGIVDIAVMQSLASEDEVKDFVKEYGMVIVDECHHVSAFSFEKILKSIQAKYVYGLTATPTRQDGQHPIIFMQCGEILHRVNAKKQAEKRSFDHIVIPRFTQFRPTRSGLNITGNYREIMKDTFRNQIIVSDIMDNIEVGRNPIILTERTEHVYLIEQQLKLHEVNNIFTLIGGRSAKESREILEKLNTIPKDENVVVIATGKYVGEGFDFPRLDTLFLAMPISWKGIVHQYVGRLHRDFAGKTEVRVYDYVDIHVPMLEKMYQKRLKSYATVGYKTRGDSGISESSNIIFEGSNFGAVFESDLIDAKKHVMIVSPLLSKRQIMNRLPDIQKCMEKKVSVTIITRPVEDYREAGRRKVLECVDLLRSAGVKVETMSKVHQKFAVIDSKIVWYGSINLLGVGASEESIMRLVSTSIAVEFEKMVSSMRSSE